LLPQVFGLQKVIWIACTNAHPKGMRLPVQKIVCVAARLLLAKWSTYKKSLFAGLQLEAGCFAKR